MAERLSWEEIRKRYPHQNVGLVDCRPSSLNIESAIVKYTEKDISYDEMCMKAFDGEVAMRFTTPEDCQIATWPDMKLISDDGYFGKHEMVPVLGRWDKEIKGSPCPCCGQDTYMEEKTILHESFDGGECIQYRFGCPDCRLLSASSHKDKNSALAEWESGKLRAEYLKAILFPSDYFDPSSVDPDLQTEYEAVKEDEMLTPILFNYEEWFEHGNLLLSSEVDTAIGAVYRGWMMKPEQYEMFYEALRKQKVFLMTLPEEYRMLHMFPNVYERVREDSARILLFPLHEPIDIALIRKSFPKFMVKDYVKSVKGTEFPKFFDESITQEEFDRWMEIFYKYRGNLLTGGICIKEYLDLKRYVGKTNEYRVFYADGVGITLEPNSGQGYFTPKPPLELVKKYYYLGSPFYTVDYAELADGSWRVIETGDGGVSGLSDRQDVKAFYRALRNKLR